MHYEHFKNMMSMPIIMYVWHKISYPLLILRVMSMAYGSAGIGNKNFHLYYIIAIVQIMHSVFHPSYKKQLRKSVLNNLHD